MSSALGALGQSRIASNPNQITRAIYTGVIVVTPEIEAEIVEATRRVAAIRNLLIEAPGLPEGSA